MASHCCRIVEAALCSHSRKEKKVIKVSCMLAVMMNAILIITKVFIFSGLRPWLILSSVCHDYYTSSCILNFNLSKISLPFIIFEIYRLDSNIKYIWRNESKVYKTLLLRLQTRRETISYPNKEGLQEQTLMFNIDDKQPSPMKLEVSRLCCS